MKEIKNGTKDEAADKSGALPKSVLVGLIGGARIDDKHQVTPEAAAALTAGGHEPGASMCFGGFEPAQPSSSVPAAPAAELAKAKMEVAITSSNIHLGEHGAFTLKFNMQESKQEGSLGPAAKFELSATGIKGQPDSVKVTLTNQDTKERTEYSANDIEAQAKAGNSLLKDLSATLKKVVASDPKKDGDLAKEIDKKFSGTVTKIGHSNANVNPDYYKFEAKRDGAGHWTTKTSSSNLDQQKVDADKAAKKLEAQAARLESVNAAQQQASQGTKQAVKNLTDAVRNVPGTVHHAADTVQPHKIAQIEHNGAVLREQLAKQDLNAAVKKLVEGEAAVKAGKADPAQLKSLSDAARQTAMSHVKAQHAVEDAKKTLANKEADRIDAAKKVTEARKEVDTAKQTLAKADDKAIDAHKAARDEGVRKRANTVAGKPDASDAATHDADGRDRSKSTGASPKSTKDDLAKDKLEKEPKQPSQSKIGKFIESKGGTILRAVGDTAAKEVAKRYGSYHESKSRDVVAGGVDQTMVRDGDMTKTTTTMAQVVTQGGTVSYAGIAGAGGGGERGIEAEDGKEVSTTIDLGNGTKKTLTDAAYAGASFNSGAKASISAGGIDAQASVKVAADAIASHTETTTLGVVKITDKVEAAAHAEAGARAGATLGFDGLNLGAKVSAEAGVKAGVSKNVSIGDAADIGADVAVFAKAKAEAKADMNLSFLGKEGTRVKAGIGAEAAAGVGVEGGTGFKGGSGGGADVGAGIYVGKIGAKADADVGFSDGKLKAEIKLGLAAGLGVNIHINVNSNIGKAVDEAVYHIKNGNVLEKAGGVAGLVLSPLVGLFI